MVARVVSTLLASEVGPIRVMTQDVEPIAAVLPADPRIGFLRSGAGIARSIAAALKSGDAPFPLFVTTADHALLRPETIAEFLRGAEGADVAVGVVERAVVQSRFPQSKRTWLRFRGGDWTGANLFYFASASALPVIETWASVEQDRKKGWKLIARFGPMLLLRALTRTITLHDAVAKAGRRMGANVRMVGLGDPLAAVDVDKVSDLELAEAVLEGRA
jgi:2-phospho-L-lactate guanylyltransferase (CobY/MobA/RfbA family)